MSLLWGVGGWGRATDPVSSRRTWVCACYLLEQPELLRLLRRGLLFVAEVLLGVALLLLKCLHLVPELQGLALQLLVLLHTLVQLILEIFGFLLQLTLNGYFLLSLMLDPVYLERKIGTNGLSIFSWVFYTRESRTSFQGWTPGLPFLTDSVHHIYGQNYF